MTDKPDTANNLTPIEPDAVIPAKPVSKGMQFFPPQKPGANSKRTAYIAELLSWGKVSPDNIEELENRVMKYFQFCFDNDIRISNQAMYLAMGLDRRTIEGWAKGEMGTPQQRTFGRKILQICAIYREQMMLDGGMSIIAGIFWQKNYDGMTDQPREVTEQRDPFEEVANLDELQDKYLIESGFDRTEMIKSHEQREKTVDRYEKRKKDRLRRVREAHENEEIDSDRP
jgi:hypothetical protein